MVISSRKSPNRPGLEQDAGDHRRDIGLRLRMGAGQPDVQAHGGGLGHEADGQQQEDPGRQRLGDLGEARQLEQRVAAARQREAGQDQEGAAEGEHQIGQRMGLRALAAQDQEVGADGQRLPGGEEAEGVLRHHQHREPGVHQHRRRIEAEAPPAGVVAGEQDQRAADEHHRREDQLQRVVARQASTNQATSPTMAMLFLIQTGSGSSSRKASANSSGSACSRLPLATGCPRGRRGPSRRPPRPGSPHA
jgi:hypothetical protein